MPHSQELSNNFYPEPNQPNSPAFIPISSRSILTLSSHLHLGLPKGLFPVGLPVKILKAFLPSSILATCPAHLNLLDLITLTILGEVSLTIYYFMNKISIISRVMRNVKRINKNKNECISRAVNLHNDRTSEDKGGIFFQQCVTKYSTHTKVRYSRLKNYNTVVVFAGLE